MERFKFAVSWPRRAHTGAAARLGALLLFTIFMLAEGAGATRLPVVRAQDSGVLTVTPHYANSGKTVTVVVDDAGLGTTALHQDEATDFTGNPYELPPGGVAQQHIFRVKEGPIADRNGDGVIDSSDIVISLNNVAVQWVNTQNGTFSVTRFLANTTVKPFTVTYRNEKLDTVNVEVRSSSDLDGFLLTLQETGLSTNLFTGTFATGTATSKTNIALPGATPRPSIKVADAGVVTVEYADAAPPTLLSSAVIIDTTKPMLTVNHPENGITTRNAQNWASVDVTDDRSGLELSAITFHADVDRDGVFNEPGEIFQSSQEISTLINMGWAAFGQINVPANDGKVSWYVSATDRAGNVARTDADPAVTGDQNHSFTIDTRPPAVVSILLGDDYDPEKERDLGNRPNMMRVNFNEEIIPESVVPGRFLFGDLTPVSAVVYEDRPDAVFLTYENLPSIAEPMLILAGAVKDLPGVDSERMIVPVTDRLGPILEVIFDTVITNRYVEVMTRSAEDLASPPTIEISGVTFGAMALTGEREREWSIQVDSTLLTGSAAGDGVKNVEIAGFDTKGNRAHGGLRREDPLWPEGAHLFELDREIKRPNILPAHNDTVKVHNPVITASYAEEGAEYPGDTHGEVTIVVAKMDDFDVTPFLEAKTSTSWTYQPDSLAPGLHQFVIQARDDAGNIHGGTTLVFTVDPLATPTPVPDATQTPTATPVPVESPGVPLPTPTATPSTEPVPTAAPTTEPTAQEPTATPSETALPTGTPDIEATVNAIRNGEGAEETPDPSLAVQPGYTLYGCGLPLGNAGVAGGDFLVIGAGMLGLVVLSRRRKGGGKDEE